jgi:hypothetical protein
MRKCANFEEYVRKLYFISVIAPDPFQIHTLDPFAPIFSVVKCCVGKIIRATASSAATTLAYRTPAALYVNLSLRKGERKKERDEGRGKSFAQESL